MAVINPLKGKKHPKIEIKSAALPTLWQRLRQVKKKDLAFILAGLSVLTLAPVAQHYMLSPSEGDDLMPGFSMRGSGDGSDSDVFEPGLGGFAPGGVPGESSDIITPLTARDPSSLLIPPGGPPAPPKASAAENVRDALNRALRKSSQSAVKQAGLPRPMPKLASALRGLAALAGGGQSRGPVPLGSGKSVLSGAQSVPNKPQLRTHSGSLAPSTFRGVSRSPKSGSGDSVEALRAQAEKAASHFNAYGPAGKALRRAAEDSIGATGSGTGGTRSGR